MPLLSIFMNLPKVDNCMPIFRWSEPSPSTHVLSTAVFFTAYYFSIWRWAVRLKLASYSNYSGTTGTKNLMGLTATSLYLSLPQGIQKGEKSHFPSLLPQDLFAGSPLRPGLILKYSAQREGRALQREAFSGSYDPTPWPVLSDGTPPIVRNQETNLGCF